jgi:hypothetical protein
MKKTARLRWPAPKSSGILIAMTKMASKTPQ